jgi:hypothetical protein
MKDIYVDTFRSIVRDTREQTGIELPEPIEVYVVMLLANYLDRPDFLPERSFAETHLKLKSSRSAKELGDACLFLTGVFPQYGSQYGIDRRYYVGIGSSSYQSAAIALNYEIFQLLGVHFEYVRNFIEITVSDQSKNKLLNLRNSAIL